MDQTRRRIVEAAVELHGTVGPANATVTRIAEVAGVTRLTVYRHFPDDETLFAACSAHWAAQLRVPNVEAWQAIEAPEARLRAALTDLYRFYAEGESMLTQVERDQDALPDSLRDRATNETRTQVSVVIRAWPARQRTRSRRALLAHAMAFSTWRSICVEQGLSRRAAVSAMTRLVMDA